MRASGERWSVFERGDKAEAMRIVGLAPPTNMLLAWRLRCAGVESVADVLPGVTVMRRVDEDCAIVFLLNYTDIAATARLRKSGYVDALTGELRGPLVEIPAAEL